VLLARGRAAGRAGARILDEALCMPITRRPPLATMVVLSFAQLEFFTRERGAASWSWKPVLGTPREIKVTTSGKPIPKGRASASPLYRSQSRGSSESRNVGSRIFSKNRGTFLQMAVSCLKWGSAAK
jgi:hypothetical protein